MFDKMKNRMLESSGSYQHYKNENEMLAKDLNKRVDDLAKENKKLKKRVRENEKRLDAYHSLFESLYLNHELTPTGVWAQVQLLQQELLTFVDNVCVKHDLDYWLDYGTLLGAVRHGGFIPWDDDVDIAMMRADFEKLQPVLKREVKDNNLDRDIDFRLYHVNIYGNVLGFIQFSYRYPNFGMVMSNVDIFPYDFRASSEGIDDEAYYQQREILRSGLREKEDPSKVIAGYMESLDLTYEHSSYVIPGAEAPRGIKQYKYNIYNENIIFPLKTIKFKDRVYKCPNNPDEYLKDIYGDYMDIPKKITHHDLIKSLKNANNIEHELDNAIDKLKRVNEEFS